MYITECKSAKQAVHVIHIDCKMGEFRYSLLSGELEMALSESPSITS